MQPGATSGARDHGRTGGGAYVNFAGLGEGNDALARAGYGRYDPTNCFLGSINFTQWRYPSVVLHNQAGGLK